MSDLADALVADLACAWAAPWKPPTPYCAGPAPPAFRGGEVDREAVARPGPQPENQIAGTAAGQLRRVFGGLARSDAGLPPPAGHDEAARLVAMIHDHRNEILAALRPIIAELVTEVLVDHGAADGGGQVRGSGQAQRDTPRARPAPPGIRVAPGT